jgi:hypothetical protein
MIEAYFLEDKRSGGDPVKVPDVAQRAAMDATLLSRNNKFFQSFGVIEGGQKKKVTEVGRSLGLAISHADQDEIRRNLARLVNDSDFLTRIQSAVKVRSGMDPDSLERHIAITAGAAKSPRTTTGTRAVIELLTEAGLLNQDESGTLRVTTGGSDLKEVSEVSGDDSPDGIDLPITSRVRLAHTQGGQVSTAGVVQHLSINLTINLDSKDLSEIEPFLRELTGLEKPAGTGDDQPD